MADWSPGSGGWKGRLSKSHDGNRDVSEKLQDLKEAKPSREKGRERKQAKEASSKEASGPGFSERMSSMFAAASNTLRPSSAKRDDQSL